MLVVFKELDLIGFIIDNFVENRDSLVCDFYRAGMRAWIATLAVILVFGWFDYVV